MTVRLWIITTMPRALFNILSTISELINKMQSIIAKVTQWLVLLMTLIVCIVVLARSFDVGSTALQESVTYMHGTVFMLSMAYTAVAGGHVRVDILYRRFNPVNKAWVNLLGSSILLLPFALFLFLITLQSAANSWAIREASNNPGGLPLVFLLKTLPPITGLLLCLHAISDICKQLCFVSIRSDKE